MIAEICDYCGKLRDDKHDPKECYLFVIAIAEGRIESSLHKRERERRQHLYETA